MQDRAGLSARIELIRPAWEEPGKLEERKALEHTFLSLLRGRYW